MNYPAPSVVRRHGSRTAIIVAKGRKLYQIIELDGKKLLVRSRSCEELQRQGYVQTELPVIPAAQKYLMHSAGVSPIAKAALEQIVEDAWLL